MSEQGLSRKDLFDDTKGSDKKSIIGDVVQLLKGASILTKDDNSSLDAKVVAQGFPAVVIDMGNNGSGPSDGKQWGKPKNWTEHATGTNDVTRDSEGRIILAHVNGKTDFFQYDKDGNLDSAMTKDANGNVETLKKVGNKYILRRGKAGQASDEELSAPEEVSNVVVSPDGSVRYDESPPATKGGGQKASPV